MLGLLDQATASVIEIVFAIVCCVRLCISLIAQWLSQCYLSWSVWEVLFLVPRTSASLRARKKSVDKKQKKYKHLPLASHMFRLYSKSDYFN